MLIQVSKDEWRERVERDGTTILIGKMEPVPLSGNTPPVEPAQSKPRRTGGGRWPSGTREFIEDLVKGGERDGASICETVQIQFAMTKPPSRKRVQDVIDAIPFGAETEGVTGEWTPTEEAK